MVGNIPFFNLSNSTKYHHCVNKYLGTKMKIFLLLTYHLVDLQFEEREKPIAYHIIKVIFFVDSCQTIHPLLTPQVVK